MNLYRLEVSLREPFNYSHIEKEIWDLEDIHFRLFTKRKCYLLKSEKELDLELIKPIFHDEITETINTYQNTQESYRRVATVHFKPGVTDNPALVAEEALQLIGVKAQVASGRVLEIDSDTDDKSLQNIIEKHFMNPLIEQLELVDNNHNRFHHIDYPVVKLKNPNNSFGYVNIFQDPDKLEKLSKTRCLALNLNEFYHIQKHYQSQDVIENREKNNLLQNPTDVEMEIIAQSWSEHCKHKIFSSQIKYRENIPGKQFRRLGDHTIDSLYKTTIKGASRKLIENGCDWTVSIFEDNAGIVNFDEHLNCCIKVETHNSPSALDPYGGAITGILGVNRDILGCGMGAKPVANTNVLCFADPNWGKAHRNLLPVGPKLPHDTLAGVHKGIEDGGNKSGIPTVNGAFYFDKSYAGKPLVYCGTIGILPKKLPNDLDAAKKHIQPKDRIFMVGGAIGVDGIHGATFSSLELDESAPATAVQIGDPLVQKRMTDFLLETRYLGLYSGITDNGAGGLSSSVGELALETNGALIDVAKCPTKYPDLLPYELVISESQERMTVAVPEKFSEAFTDLAKSHGVIATDIGEFNNSGYFSINFNQHRVAHLDLDFLHNSLPQMKLKAEWDGPRENLEWQGKQPKQALLKNFESSSISTILEILMSNLNIASKEKWIRRYDHEVGAATQLKPLQGKEICSPNNAGVIKLEPYGGEPHSSISIGCGLSPHLSQYDPYYMAQVSVDEAVRNIIATGANPEKICILDNFCWPDPIESQTNPEGQYRLGQLVRACRGLHDTALTYKTPIVSGKDSMKNNFSGENQQGEKLRINVLPTLLITSMGYVDSRIVTSSDFKNPGDKIYLIGNQSNGLAYSEISKKYILNKACVPTIDLALNNRVYRTIYQLITGKCLASCHDISDGGLITAIAESCFRHMLGAELYVEKSSTLKDFLFNEGAGRFIVSVPQAKNTEFLSKVESIPYQLIGMVTDRAQVTMQDENISVKSLYEIWSTQFEKV